jgi:hypothetical protein
MRALAVDDYWHAVGWTGLGESLISYGVSMASTAVFRRWSIYHDGICPEGSVFDARHFCYDFLWCTHDVGGKAMFWFRVKDRQRLRDLERKIEELQRLVIALEGRAGGDEVAVFALLDILAEDQKNWLLDALRSRAVAIPNESLPPYIPHKYRNIFKDEESRAMQAMINAAAESDRKRKVIQSNG